MNETQRAAAERLADELQRFDGAERESLRDEAAALLRELAAEPMQEPAIWIQSNHLQHAKNGPYLARTGPTKLMSDFIPLYAAPQQRKPLTDEAIEAILDEFDVDREAWKPLARAIERAITGEPT